MSNRFDIATGRTPWVPIHIEKEKEIKRKKEILLFAQLKKYSNVEILIETFGIGDWMLLKFFTFLKKKHPKGYSGMITKEIR